MFNREDGGWRHGSWSKRSIGAKVAMIVAAIILAPGFLALFAAVTMWLWNWLMPVIFKLPIIGFWQAAGILVLSHILFKGGRIGRAGRSSWKKARIREQMAEEGQEAKAQ
jgi:hypothetical protein